MIGAAATVRPEKWARLLLLALAAAAAFRVVATYRVFSETNDEHHFVAGLEWWDKGAYTYGIYHPPLARIFEALPLYLAGARSHGKAELVDEKNAILYAGSGYATNLAMGRFGALPFFLLAIVVVWLWSRRLFGVPASVAATLLFSTLPPVLAHAGLATTDAPLMATLCLALFAFCLFLESPTLARGALLGLAWALAVLAKFSALPFFLCAVLAILLVRAVAGRRPEEKPRISASHVLECLALAAVVAAIVVWAGYRFSWGIVPETLGSRTRDILIGPAARAQVGTRVPAPEFFEGLRLVRQNMREGHPAYLLGRYSQTGWWYYFPVALAVKTPLPFLLLTVVGGVASLFRASRQRDWRLAAPLAAGGALLVACLPSRIDIGIRHLLAIYPLLSIAAGYGVVTLWNSRRWEGAARVGVVALLGWQLVGSVRAHPDYLAWFNELAGSHPDRILLDSNLDWGQDLYRLSDALAARGVDSVALAYLGNADLSRHGLPPIRPLSPDHPTTGWIAISQMWLKDVPGRGKAYAWLRDREPVATVGRSILLYYLPPPRA